MPTLSHNNTVSGLGGQISSNVSRTGDGGANREIALLVAHAGVLTTRTDDTTGTITMDDAGHPIQTGEDLDVYWFNPDGVQYNVTAGTVVANNLPISGGSGAVLPPQDTAVLVGRRVNFNVTIDGDSLHILGEQVLVIGATSGAGHVQYLDAAPASVAATPLEANVARVYDVDGGDNNPFAGKIVASGNVSQSDQNTAGTFKLLFTHDATP